MMRRSPPSSTGLPTRDEMDPSINEQLIVEFYSRF